MPMMMYHHHLGTYLCRQYILLNKEILCIVKTVTIWILRLIELLNEDDNESSSPKEYDYDDDDNHFSSA